MFALLRPEEALNVGGIIALVSSEIVLMNSHLPMWHFPQLLAISQLMAKLSLAS